MKKILTLAAVATLLLTACNQDENTSGVIGGNAKRLPVTIDPTLLEMSRATDVDFEAGDKIGLTIKMTDDASVYAENKLFTYADGKFVSADKLEWYEDIGRQSELLAYHPYSATVPTEFTVQADQSAGNYTLSDLMIATKSNVTPTVEATNMTFRHQLTKLDVVLDNQSGGSITGVTIQNLVPTATVNIAEGTVAVKEGVTASDIKAAQKVADKQFSAIVIPQTAAPKVAVTVKIAGVEKTLAQSYKESTLKPGRYTMKVKVLVDHIELVFTGDIEDWTDNGELAPEDAPDEPDEIILEEHLSDGYIIYHNEKYNVVTMKDGNIWMAQNLRYVPAGKSVSSDPAVDGDGIWYCAANATKTADPESAATLGLLYSADAIFGTTITADNAASFEGAQGICPEGWHIPTNAEATGLVGHNSNGALTDTSAPYYDATTKGALISALNADGFNWTSAGARNKATATGTGSYLVTSYDGVFGVMSYVWTSTHYQTKMAADGTTLSNIQYYGMMSTVNASNNKVTVAYANFMSGYSLRCVRNK